MLFRPTIGTWCKDTANLQNGEKVIIVMIFEFLSFSCQEHSAPNLHISSTSPLAILYTRDDFSSV